MSKGYWSVIFFFFISGFCIFLIFSLTFYLVWGIIDLTNNVVIVSGE